MNILYITDNNIMGHGGGCLGARKYYSAIKSFALKNNADFKVISLGQNMPEAIDLFLTLPRTLISVIFQMTGMIKQYSYSLMSESISSFFMIVVMLVLGIRDYQYLILADCGARFISLCVSLHNAPGFIGRQVMDFYESIKEAFSNISVGIFLLLSNMVGLVVIASVRFAVEDQWGIVAFSKVSLAFSISSVAITATSAASVVLFPLLKRLNKENLDQTFSALSLLLMVLLIAAFSLYYPGVNILGWWLPKYSESFYYLTIILPMTLFDSNFSVIGSNFLKVMRKERSLLLINVLAILFTWGCVVIVRHYNLKSCHFISRLVHPHPSSHTACAVSL